MGTCSNCGANVPLKKSLAGRPLEKQDRDCPDCGKSIGPEDNNRLLFKSGHNSQLSK